MNGSPHQSALRYRFSDKIPDSYDEAILKVLPCNPFRVYVYWDLPETMTIDNSRWWLRYAADDSSGVSANTEFMEIEIPPSCREWYLDLPHPEAAYSIGLIKETSGNVRSVVLQSGNRMPATAPPVNPSPAGQPATPAMYCRPTDGLITTPATVHKDIPTFHVEPGCENTAARLSPTIQPSSWALQGSTRCFPQSDCCTLRKAVSSQ